MSFHFRRYKVTVGFKVNGALYGEEIYTVLATDEDQAERKARVNATASQYDDDRIPDRRVVILDVEETEDEQAQAA